MTSTPMPAAARPTMRRRHADESPRSPADGPDDDDDGESVDGRTMRAAPRQSATGRAPSERIATASTITAIATTVRGPIGSPAIAQPSSTATTGLT